MWQDYVIAVIQWTFVIALIPSLIHPTQKPAVMTSLMTGILLIVLGFAYASLDLWKSFIPVVLLAFAWFLLAYQRHRLNQKDSTSRL